MFNIICVFYDRSKISLSPDGNGSSQAGGSSGNSYTDYSGNRLICNSGYKLVSKNQLPVFESEIVCLDGKWTLFETNARIDSDSCVQHCTSSCLNGGKCTAPDTCQCTEKFTGSDCGEKACSDTLGGPVIERSEL